MMIIKASITPSLSCPNETQISKDTNLDHSVKSVANRDDCYCRYTYVPFPLVDLIR